MCDTNIASPQCRLEWNNGIESILEVLWHLFWTIRFPTRFFSPSGDEILAFIAGSRWCIAANIANI